MRLNDDRHLSLTFHYRSSQNKLNTGRGATYNVVETVVHPIKVGLNGLKERSCFRSCILEYNAGVQTSQVILEILE